MGGTGRPLGETFFLHCQTRHPELPKIPTYLPKRIVFDDLEPAFLIVKYLASQDMTNASLSTIAVMLEFVIVVLLDHSCHNIKS